MLSKRPTLWSRLNDALPKCPVGYFTSIESAQQGREPRSWGRRGGHILLSTSRPGMDHLLQGSVRPASVPILNDGAIYFHII
jgi:hypothetical protein